MKIFTKEAVKTLALFTLAPVVLLLALDFWVAPDPVVGTVVDEIHNELVTVEWTASDGTVQRQDMELPPEWVGATRLPIYQHATWGSIGITHVSGAWYLLAGLTGFLAGLFVVGLRRKPGREAMIRIAPPLPF